MKLAMVCGAGGFSGGHRVKRLREERLWVKGGTRNIILPKESMSWNPEWRLLT